MKPGPITATHDVMKCPACDMTIVAKVEVEVALGTPSLKAGGTDVEITATPTLRRFTINHHCSGRDQVEDDRPFQVSA